jgi:glycosyltransferase involved in cell wall biosynthesis
MKILWFTNIPSLASEYLNQSIIGGSWISSLEKTLSGREEIQLAIAFRHGDNALDKFVYQKTTYYSIPYPKGKIKNLFYRHFNIINDKELITHCLDIVEDFKPDLINIFGTEEAWGLIANKVSVPVVIHLQGILTVYEKKWFSAHVGNKSILRVSNFKSLLTANTFIHYYSSYKKSACREQSIFRSCQYFLGRTDWDRRVTSVLSPQSTYFVSNEILRSEFYTTKWNKTQEQKKVFISTVQPNIYKGLETILEAAILLKKRGEFDFTWFIAGPSENDVVVKLFERRIKKKFRECNIVLAGKLDVHKLLKLELEADIFIHPSHIENSPNSVCEAMMLGMPIIATFTGGTGSLLEDKKEGILIQDGDPYSMAGSILELIDNPDQANHIGENARMRALKRHNADEIANNLLKIYREIISRDNIEATKFFSNKPDLYE